MEIEHGMLQSITRTCENSDVKIEDIDTKAGSWGGSYRDRLEAIGLGMAIPSSKADLSVSPRELV